MLTSGGCHVLFAGGAVSLPSTYRVMCFERLTEFLGVFPTSFTDNGGRLIGLLADGVGC